MNITKKRCDLNAQSMKKKYKKPVLKTVGSVSKLTLKAGGSADGGIPGVFTP
jgi:hypothetical protein